jgi:hypothetical protein
VSTFIKKYQQDIQGMAIEVAEENNPYETDLDKHQWEIRNQQEIWANRYCLKHLEKEIKEIRKTIKKMNKEQNLKNNI